MPESSKCSLLNQPTDGAKLTIINKAIKNTQIHKTKVSKMIFFNSTRNMSYHLKVSFEVKFTFYYLFLQNTILSQVIC